MPSTGQWVWAKGRDCKSAKGDGVLGCHPFLSCVGGMLSSPQPQTPLPALRPRSGTGTREFKIRPPITRFQGMDQGWMLVSISLGWLNRRGLADFSLPRVERSPPLVENGRQTEQFFTTERMQGQFIKHYVAALSNPAMMGMAVRVALVVGSLLFTINHGAALAQGQMTRSRWTSAILTYCVPYLVSIHGQCASQQRQRSQS